MFHATTHLNDRADLHGRWKEAAAGARAMTSWLFGIVPFGLVIGTSAARSHVSTVAGWATGPLIYAGSAQVAVIDLLDKGAAPLVVITTAAVVNLRLALYSASMAHYWRDTPRWWRAIAAYLLVEPSFAVGLNGYSRSTDRRRSHDFYLGGAALLWVTWLMAIAVGAAAGARLPASLHLEFVIPLFLVGEVAARLQRRSARHAAGVAAVVAAVTASAPLQLGLLIAIGAGIAAGVRAEGKVDE